MQFNKPEQYSKERRRKSEGEEEEEEEEEELEFCHKIVTEISKY